MKALYVATCHLIDGGHGYGKSPIVEIHGKCVYKNGDYSIYVHIKGKAYYHLWKNVVITELCGENRELIDCLATGKPYDETPRCKFIYDGAIRDKADSEKYAKHYNFAIA